jgi:hypothetical protein
MWGGVGRASCVAAVDDVGIAVAVVAVDVAWKGSSDDGARKYDPCGGNVVGADVGWYIDE